MTLYINDPCQIFFLPYRVAPFHFKILIPIQTTSTFIFLSFCTNLTSRHFSLKLSIHPKSQVNIVVYIHSFLVKLSIHSVKSTFLSQFTYIHFLSSKFYSFSTYVCTVQILFLTKPTLQPIIFCPYHYLLT